MTKNKPNKVRKADKEINKRKIKNLNRELYQAINTWPIKSERETLRDTANLKNL